MKVNYKCLPNKQILFIKNDIAVQLQIPNMLDKASSELCKEKVAPLRLQNPWTSGRKSQIYDCYGVLEKAVCVWRLLGIFPFTLKGTMGFNKYELSKFYVLYNFLLFVLCITNFIIGVNQYKSDFSLSVATTPIAIRTVASLLYMFMCAIMRSFFHKEVSESIELIAAQQRILEKLNCRLNYESSGKRISRYVRGTLVMITFLMAYDFYTSWNSNRSSIIQWIFWILPILIQVVDLTLFVSLVALLGLKLEALNEKIKTVVLRANSSSPKVIVTSDVCAENLRLVAKVHYNICSIGKRINDIFNWEVIINVLVAFIILSTTLYYIFAEVQKEGRTNYFRVVTYIHWEIIHSVPIITIVMICNWTSHQAIYSGKLIHEIRVERTDSRLYEIVKSFSLQLHHQKLEFSGLGFFPLNSTLLQSMVGNITTYLVILIQFEPSLEGV